MSHCLYCYKALANGEKDFHHACARRFFGTTTAPTLDYRRDQIDELASQVIQEQTSLTGVQPKLSMNLAKHEGSSRLTIVGLWGGYICKPQAAHYAFLPENEDLTMHLAQIARIAVVPHTLMRMGDNSLCYITKRIDRTAQGEKIAMEDMCQITEHLTEHKYRSSHERIAKAIGQYSAMPQLDTVNFFELVLFCWLTGNNDMHLKNFSLYEPEEGTMVLTPAYDLLNATIANPDDDEELALTLNGRKKHIVRKDFLAAAKTMNIGQHVAQKLINKYVKLYPKLCDMIEQSFLPPSLKEDYRALLAHRLKLLQD